MRLHSRDRRTDVPAPAELTTPDEAVDESLPSGLSRRLLLTRGSLGVVAAGVMSAMPALPAVANTAETEAPDASAMVSDSEELEGPLLAQVKNLQTGEVSLFSGAREISIIDRGLAARLFNAAK
jgi:hypothetical protein